MESAMMTLLTVVFTLLAMSANILHLVSAEEPEKYAGVFVNEHPKDEITLYWVNPAMREDDPARFKVEAVIPPRGGVHHSTTYHGHEFYYEYDGTGNYFVMDLPNAHKEQLVVLANHRGEGIRVRCDISVNAGRAEASFDIMVQPFWAPRGATRFLELVRAGYYNGVVFNRVVPKFLIQFGIAEGYKERTDVQDVAIWDDYPRNIAFEPGTISYAGSGFDSRTSEIFIAMPGSSKEQLSKFGENSWETPFGFVEGDLSVLNKIYSGYGDMPPWGKGPDSQRIYAEDGYTKYLPKNFPKLDKIQTCYIVDEVGLADEL